MHIFDLLRDMCVYPFNISRFIFVSFSKKNKNSIEKILRVYFTGKKIDRQ